MGMRRGGRWARDVLLDNRFLTLATADAEGLPWASPVWFATRDCREIFWVSSPTARHSRATSRTLRPDRVGDPDVSTEPRTQTPAATDVAESLSDGDRGVNRGPANCRDACGPGSLVGEWSLSAAA